MSPPPNSLYQDPPTTRHPAYIALNRLQGQSDDDVITLEVIRAIMEEMFGRNSRRQRHNYGGDGSDYKYVM